MSKWIDADAAIDAARRSPVGRLMIKKHNLDGWLMGLPAADVAPVRRGRWERQDDQSKSFYGWPMCSECGALSAVMTPFCCGCGATMDGGAIGDPMEDDLK